MEGDDRTFSTDFTNEGVARLREQVEEKLKEFMGDYTDETLVEYVIVLLKNGRRKDEARNELDVFLGDDSDSFVTWLWDHLGSHISLYVQPSHQDGAKNTKLASMEPGRTVSHQIESEAEKKPSRKRRSSQWKELLRDEKENEGRLPESSMAVHVNDQDGLHRRIGLTKRPSSPWQTNEKKRRPEERQPVMKDVSQTTAGGSRRLLQFAVRDAVMLPNTPTEPATKHLRSVVATSTGDLLPEKRPMTNRLAAGSRADMSAAIKAVAEAANDVSKVRPPRSVFDRLGHTSGDVHNSIINSEEEYRGLNEDGVDKNYSDERDGIMSRGKTILASDLGYDDVDSRGQRALGTSSEAHDFDERSEGPHIDLDQPSTTYNSSLKVVPSVNMDTLRTSQYDDVRKVNVMDHAKLIQNDAAATKFEASLTKENSNPIMEANGNAKPETHPRKEISQKTQGPTGDVYSTGQLTEDTDSRTIYVSNVHFAAKKDSLSRHFNKFGEVLKVVLLTDPATGQPKGSAYIEFTRKEAAAQALSLNGTSFLSRILKVVRKSSVQPEASATVTSWPRVARASPFPVPRLFSRAPFGRGIPSLYRPRTPIKPGVRSFQWKREAAAQTSGTEIPGQFSTNVVTSPMTRSSLTYVRTEPKTEEAKTIANSGTA